MNERTDVVVVGAGLSGLACARRLLEAGVDVQVLEARERVGGRIERVEVSDGLWLDLGGQWIGPGQERAAALVAEFGLATFPTFGAGRHVLEVRGRNRPYESSLPLGPLATADVQQARYRLDRLARRIPAGRPWTAPHAGSLDAETFATWCSRNVFTPQGRAVVETSISAAFALDSPQLSMLDLLAGIRSSGGIEVLLGTEGGAQQDRIEGGAPRLAEGLAERLGDRLTLGVPVRAIDRVGEDVVVRGDDAAVRAGKVVVAIPPTLAGRISYDPPLPGDRDQLTQRMPHGAVIKAQAVYPEPFWREDGWSGQVLSSDGPVTSMYDNSPASGQPGVLLAFVGGRHAIRLGTMPEERRRGLILDGFTRFFGPRAGRPERYVERDWQAEPWSRGCYGAHSPTGVLTRYGHALARPFGPIHWAGTETAEQWAGYMDGALEAGERAADEVLAAG